MVSQLFKRIGFQFARRLIIRIGKNDFTDHLSHPAIIPPGIIDTGFFKDRAGSAHVIDILFRRLDRRQFIERRRIAVEPAKIVDIGGFDNVAYRAVIATACPGFSQPVRQGEISVYFIPRQPLIRQSERLVVDIAVDITLAFHQLHHFFVTPRGPVVLSDNDFRFITPTIDGVIDVL